MKLALLSLLPVAWLYCQTAQPQFEAASIKMTAPTGGGGHSHEHDTPGMLRASMTLKSYIISAYGVAQVAGGPAWIDDTTYDIVAKLDLPEKTLAALTPQQREDQLHAAMQALLAERFHLKAHRETREEPGYALTAAKRGSKLQPAPDNSHCGSNSKGDGNIVTLTATCIDMREFAWFLAHQTKMPVNDQTQLAGTYTFSLEWTPDDLKTIANSDRPALPSLFTVLEEKLGLKLESRKIPVDVIVVDGAERPTEN